MRAAGTQPASPADLAGQVLALRTEAASAPLPLSLPGASQARADRDALVAQLDDYVLPRLASLDAPLLAVVGGSTGSGKSTLVSSVVGARVSEPGVLRPTTRAPVLVHHPEDVAWFEDTRVLPSLARVTGTGPEPGPGALRLVAHPGVPRGLALLDAPDIDSVAAENRALAAQLLAAADLWVFVTTAARYADQVPWGFLTEAAERSVALGLVLDRTDDAAVAEVAGHLREMLDERGLAEARLMTVPEAALDGRGLLAADRVAEIRDWLHGLAADAEARAEVVRRTLDGALAAACERAEHLAAAVEEQQVARAALERDAAAAYDDAVRDVDDACSDGTLLRGEVLARWQEFVGAGKVLRALETGAGRLRDRVAAAVTGRPPAPLQVSQAVESRLEVLVVEHGERAAERARSAWVAHPAGRDLLAGGDADLGRASRDLRERTERAVREWQAGVLELVRSEGAEKRSTARFLAFGVNGLGVALMVVVFAHTGGLLAGAEVGVAGGSAVVGQKLLEAVFGDQAVRRLAAQARNDLSRRVTDLMLTERARFTALLDGGDLADLGDHGSSTAPDRQLLRRAGAVRAAAGVRGGRGWS
ncbi:ABC transporter [Nocardioidaceae bacterium]|nr:ABC transporter [Nocardioidaceae bacterium]